jgi:GrpB-like predicted nucleotidyltransferase (UPF0157 family)
VGEADDWPAWARQPVEIVEADPTWAQRADDLATDLQRRLGPWLDGSVEHVGSTAVPGLAAKPVLDLLAPVTSLADAALADDVLAAAAWHLVPPELDARPWRRLHVLADGDRRVAHLRLVASTHPHCRELVRFRDLLRDDPDVAAEYAHLKRRAAAAHGHDREAYTRAKAEFVEHHTTRGEPQTGPG